MTAPAADKSPHIHADPGRWRVEGPVTIEHYASLRSAAEMLGELPRSVDWSAATEVDSSALSLMLTLCRAAQAAGRDVAHVGLTPNLQSLAALYGVEAWLSETRPAVERV